MLPTYLKTKDPMLAWTAGLVWALIIGVIVLLGAFVGPTIRKHTPRAAMLGTLAGISIAFISMRPAFQMWELPWVSFVSLGIVLVSWTANVRLPGGLPGGLAAVIVGTVIAWIAAALGWSDYMKGAEVAQALAQFGLHLPHPSFEVLTGLGSVAPLLVTAIPLGIYNFTEGMNNVESAAAAQVPVAGALNAAGTSASMVGLDKLGASGLVYHGMDLLGGGAVLAGLVLGAIAAFIIDRDFIKASIYSLAGAVLSFFGFIHGAELGFAVSSQVALGYVFLAGICFWVCRPEAKPLIA